jgi:hypothetical protein
MNSGFQDFRISGFVGFEDLECEILRSLNFHICEFPNPEILRS